MIERALSVLLCVFTISSWAAEDASLVGDQPFIFCWGHQCQERLLAKHLAVTFGSRMLPLIQARHYPDFRHPDPCRR